QLGEAALQRVALAVDPDLRHHDAIVRAQDAAVHVRPGIGERGEQFAACHARGRRAETGVEIAASDALVLGPVVGHRYLPHLVARAASGCTRPATAHVSTPSCPDSGERYR